MSKPTTVKVFIAVAVDQKGNWCANGYGDSDGCHESNERHGLQACDGMPDETDRFVVHWVEADLPLPNIVEGQVVQSEQE